MVRLSGWKLEQHPAIILMSGLQGSGKTTFSGKLANMLKKQNKKPLLVACDVYRPAAIDQLKVVGQAIDVSVYNEPENKNVNEIADHAIQEAKAKGNDVVIIDTAGRLAVDEEMMNEIESLKNHVHPDETLFVVDSMTGQDAVNTAKEFNDRLDFNGVVLTKLDGDTAVVRPSLSVPLSTNLSCSSVPARRWRLSTCSTPSAWLTVSSVWVMSYLSSARSGAVRRGGGTQAPEENPEEQVRLQRFLQSDTADKEDG